MNYTSLTVDIETDRKLIDSYLDRLLTSDTTVGPALEAMRYAVLGGGQRLRPLLSLRVARMLDAECAGTLRAAAAVELLHCASLIVDDLPSMDNSSQRRGLPSTHVAFGEPVALLASFALVALAARILVDGELSPHELSRLVEFQKRLLATLDPASLIAGQAMDLQLSGEARHRQLNRISELKTVPLFQIALQAGAIFSRERDTLGGALDQLGHQFGMSYQMADDYLDGEVCDLQLLQEQFDSTRQAIRQFGSGSNLLEEVLDYIHGKACETDRCHR